MELFFQVLFYIIIAVPSFLLVIHQVKSDSRRQSEYSYKQKHNSSFYLMLFVLTLIPFLNIVYFLGYGTTFLIQFLTEKIDNYRNIIKSDDLKTFKDFDKLKRNLIKAKIFKDENEIYDFIESSDVLDKLSGF